MFSSELHFAAGGRSALNPAYAMDLWDAIQGASLTGVTLLGVQGSIAPLSELQVFLGI